VQCCQFYGRRHHMTTFTIDIQDTGLREALSAVAAKGEDMQPFLQTLGDDLVERVKRRFETSTGPDGVAWKPNAPATLDALSERLGKSYRKKSGALNAKGQQKIAGKRPLIDTGLLRQQIVAQANRQSVTVSATSLYAAIHQFGGQAGRGKKITIPARPFMPVQADGDLYPQERAFVLNAINSYLSGR